MKRIIGSLILIIFIGVLNINYSSQSMESLSENGDEELTEAQIGKQKAPDSIIATLTQDDHSSSRFLRLIMILEDGLSENAFSKNRVLMSDLMEALHDQTAPIIVSAPILHSYFTLQQQTLSPASHIELNTLTTKYKDLQNTIQSKKAELLNKKEKQQKYENTYKQINNEISTTTVHETKMALYGKLEKLHEANPSPWEDIFSLEGEISNLKSEQDNLEHQFGKLENKVFVSEIYLSQFVLVTPQEWDIYEINTSNMYLLIPKKYITHIQKEWNKLSKTTTATPTHSKNDEQAAAATTAPLSEKELMLGLKVDHHKLFTKIEDHNKLKKTLDSKWGSQLSRLKSLPAIFGKDLINTTALHEIFVTNSTHSHAGIWNIFITGHGLYSRSQYLKSSKAKEDPLASIAGLTLDKFRQLVTFFSNNITVTTLFFMTCYSGGYHLSTINQHAMNLENENDIKQAHDVINRVNPPYMLISATSIDSPTMGGGPIRCGLQSFINYFPLFPDTYSLYFNKLESFLMPIITSMLEKPVNEQVTIFDNLVTANITELNSIFKTIITQECFSGDTHATSGIPSIRLRTWNEFRVPPQEDIAIINTEQLAKDRALFQQEQIPGIQINNKKAIIFAVNTIDIPLIISNDLEEKYTAIPAFIPRDLKHDIYYFDQLFIEEKFKDSRWLTSFNEFITSIFSVESVHSKLFNIKSIDVKNEHQDSSLPDSDTLPLRDVWIEKNTKKWPFGFYRSAQGRNFTTGKIVFKVFDTYYYCTWSLKNELSKWKKINKASFDKIVTEMKSTIIQQ